MSELNNIDAIADQIYQEGIEKVEKEANEILQNAKNEAERLVKEAEAKAEQLINKANAEAERSKKSAMNEVTVKARQALSDLKTQIEQLVTAELLEEPVKGSFNKTDFMSDLLVKAVGHWNTSDDIEVSLPESQKKEIQSYINKKHGDVLKKININPDEKLKKGFTITHKNQGYFISFSDEDFVAYLKPYFSNSLQNALFE